RNRYFFKRKYQYSTKTCYCKCRKPHAQKGIFVLSTSIKICGMSQQQSNQNSRTYKSSTPVNDLLIVKTSFVKACKHRTSTGFCVRSNRQCPATLFNLSVNK